jgi:predicted enzyme related to lactoylglutathione lyase
MELANITFDASDPVRLATFWAAATGWQLTESTPDVALLTSAAHPIRLLFLKVAESKTTKNRMHVDFRTADRAAEVSRLERLGATAHATHHEHGIIWTVMTDPEGNEFCVAQF